MIAVGDFVLFEYIFSRDMEFKVGEVVCVVDEHAIVVKEGWQVTVERRDMVGFVGTLKQAIAMKAKVDAMLMARSKAVDAAQKQVHELAGRHAGAIRKMLKQK